MTSRVAVVHEWFSTVAGSERVVEQILRVLPDADLFTLVDVLPEHERGFLGRTPRTSFVQRIPFAARHFRALLPMLPLAIEQFDLSSYDIVVSSSHAFAKGILTGPDQLHVCYCHTPLRYAWELQHQYLREAGLYSGISSWVVRLILHYLRLWDTRTAHGVDCFIANSRFVAARIRKTYGRDAVVIHPPVNVDFFQCRPDKEQFYLAASRFVPYKRMDLIIKAFAAMPERRLVVVGDGPDWKRCKALTTPNIEMIGYQSAESLRDLLQRARAFVFAAEEDFGILPVEAQACGTPVICYGRGGVLDSVVPGITGLFFGEQTPEAICDAVARSERQSFDPWLIRSHAESFCPENFRSRFRRLLDELIAARTAAASAITADHIS